MLDCNFAVLSSGRCRKDQLVGDILEAVTLNRKYATAALTHALVCPCACRGACGLRGGVAVADVAAFLIDTRRSL